MNNEGQASDEQDVRDAVPDLVEDLAHGVGRAGLPGDLAIEQVEDQPQRRQYGHREEQDRPRVRQRQAEAADRRHRDGRQGYAVGTHST